MSILYVYTLTVSLCVWQSFIKEFYYYYYYSTRFGPPALSTPLATQRDTGHHHRSLVDRSQWTYNLFHTLRPSLRPDTTSEWLFVRRRRRSLPRTDGRTNQPHSRTGLWSSVPSRRDDKCRCCSNSSHHTDLQPTQHHQHQHHLLVIILSSSVWTWTSAYSNVTQLRTFNLTICLDCTTLQPQRTVPGRITG